MGKTYLTKSPTQTKKLGVFLAKKILKSKTQKKARVLGLEGDLGGGKTTFLQGFAKGLGIEQKILSPTFVIMKRFPISTKNLKNFYHFDCYRVGKPKEILNLNFKEISSDSQNIIVIEWAEKIRQILPKNTKWIRFQFVDKRKRRISVNEHNE